MTILVTLSRSLCIRQITTGALLGASNLLPKLSVLGALPSSVLVDGKTEAGAEDARPGHINHAGHCQRTVRAHESTDSMIMHISMVQRSHFGLRIRCSSKLVA